MGALVALLSITSGTFAQSGNSQSIFGIWLTASQDVVEIYEKEGKLFGKITKLAEPTDENGQPWKDTKNPTEKLRNRPILGIDVLLELTYEGKNKWDDGKVYVPDEGKYYDCELRLQSDGKLKVSGCVTFFCDSEYWKRK